MDPTEVLAILMARYDRMYPDATEFARGSWRYEITKALDELDTCGLMVVHSE